MWAEKVEHYSKLVKRAIQAHKTGEEASKREIAAHNTQEIAKRSAAKTKASDILDPDNLEIIRLPFFKDLDEPISTMECQPRVLLPLDAIEQ